jgi:hypothetical protein
MKNQTLHRWLFGLAGLILMIGILIAVMLFKQHNLDGYPNLISEAYQYKRHHLVVPENKIVELTRTGTYGIYFEHDLTSSIYPEIEIPPEIDCMLTFRENGTTIIAVPDYVKTNHYTSKDLHTGVLIMSITVDKPGSYNFTCNYQDNRTEPGIRVSLGPNYFWEFLRVIWRIGLPLLGGGSVLCGFFPLASLLFITGIVVKYQNKRKQ